MGHRIIRLSFLFLVITIGSCYYDVEEVLYPGGVCVTDNMSYQNNIEPIIDRNCYSCHSAAVNTGNITLEGYAELIKYIPNGRLLGAIRHESGFQPMPQNAGQLGSCDISKIEHWVMDGFPNN